MMKAQKCRDQKRNQTKKDRYNDYIHKTHLNNAFQGQGQQNSESKLHWETNF